MSSPNKVGAALASVGLLTDVDTAQRNVLGTVVWDDAGGAYVYLGGVASLAQFDWVMYSLSTFIPTRLLNDAGSATAGLVGVAMSAVVATDFGWFQIYGPVASANIATTSSVSFSLYRTSTAGRASVSAVAKDCIFGAYTNAASVSNVGPAFVNWPHVTDNSTL